MSAITSARTKLQTPIRLDDIEGLLICYGYGTSASIEVTRSAGLSLASAREALYYAVLDGRARIPAETARNLDLAGPAPRIHKPFP